MYWGVDANRGRGIRLTRIANLAAAALVLIVLVANVSEAGAGPAMETWDSFPAASAGADQIVDEDTSVAFDGSGSSDDLGVVNWTWAIEEPAGSVPREIAWLTADITDAIFDPIRPYVYVSSKSSRSVQFVNLNTGAVDETFTFSRMTERLAITPDASRLFVALLTREHSSTWWDEDGHEGYVASWDLATRTKDREFHITEDPYDLAATSDGHLVVPSGSGQWTYIRVFDAATGAETGSAGTIRHYSRVTLHPSETRVYTADIDVSPSDIERYDVSGGTITRAWDSPYHGQHRMGGNVWASPLGDRLVTRGGDLFTSALAQAEDMVYVKGLGGPFEDVAFDESRGLAVAGGVDDFGTGGLSYYDLGTWTLLGSNAALDVEFVGVQGDRILAITPGGDVLAVAHPRNLLYGVRPSYVFREPGTYTVTLTVRDAAGQSDSDAMTVVVRDATAPVASAGPDREVYLEALVIFDGSSSTDNIGIVSHEWTFEDGVPVALSGAVVTHRFETSGPHVVTLTVADAEGNAASDSLVVDVAGLPPFVLRENAARGFRIGVPEDWSVQLDVPVEEETADLTARGDLDSGALGDLVVVSVTANVVRSDDFLLELARDAIEEFRIHTWIVSVLSEPEVVSTANARAAVFEVLLYDFAGSVLYQVWGVIADRGHRRVWMVAGSVGNASMEEFGPLFRHMIRSFEVLPPPGPLDDPAARSAFVSVGLATAVALFSMAVWFRRTGRRRRRAPSPPNDGPDPPDRYGRA